jgi:hypothetical protein
MTQEELRFKCLQLAFDEFKPEHNMLTDTQRIEFYMKIASVFFGYIQLGFYMIDPNFLNVDNLRQPNMLKDVPSKNAIYTHDLDK